MPTTMNEDIKVLIIDDDPMTLRIISTVLSRKGYPVFTSQTAVDVFNTVEKYDPDVILMDYDMPVVSGVYAIIQLK
jgi:CheY-like chemotaxis protein